MREKTLQLVITFKTTTSAMAMEKWAKANNINGRLIPLPTSISASCGLAFKTEINQKEFICNAMSESGLEWDTTYELMLY